MEAGRNPKVLQYLRELRQPVEYPSLEPELDDVDEKLDKQLREQMDLDTGAVRKGILQQGQGSETPAEGDLVYFHLTLRKEDGEVLETTRLDEEGSGIPKAFVLGKGLRAPRGWELAIQEMLKAERAVFRISPEYSFAQKGCKVAPPAGVSKDASLLVDIQLVNWYRSKDGVRAVGEAGVIKRTTIPSESWEHPNPPFEVAVSLTARIPSSSGRQGEGAPFFSSGDAPLVWELGSGAVSAVLEEGLSEMAKAEKAFLSCPAHRAEAPGALIPDPGEGVDRVEYEVELLSMVQVRDLTGTGEVTKRRIREGIGEFPIDCPLEDNAVRAHFRCLLPGSSQVLYDSRGPDGSSAALEFDTGVDAVPEAVDMCIRLMTPQEVAIVRSSPRFAYQGRADRPPGCLEDANVEFEVELLSFEKTPHWQAMDAARKISRAEQLRLQGNTTYKLGQLRFARHKYMKALKLLDNAYDAESDEEVQAVSAAKANCHANLALICQREHNLTECFSWCEKALREDPDHAKALYRRGTAHGLLGEFAEAERDLLHAQEADPATAADIDRELVRMRARQKAAAEKERREFRNFFDRGPKVNETQG